MTVLCYQFGLQCQLIDTVKHISSNPTKILFSRHVSSKLSPALRLISAICNETRNFSIKWEEVTKAGLKLQTCWINFFFILYKKPVCLQTYNWTSKTIKAKVMFMDYCNMGKKIWWEIIKQGFLIAFFTDNWIQLTTTVKYKVAFCEHRWP